MLGSGEIIVILCLVMLLFGGKKLPEFARSLGKGIREFKGSVREIEGELKAPLNDLKSVPPKTSNEQDQGPRRLAVTDEEKAD